MAKKPKLIVMVSSTVYGIEELLDRVYSILTNFGYEVWMSHKGTVPVLSNKTAFDNCLDAVKNCDLFLGIITTHYGSGKEDKKTKSITHQELLKAIELNKPRWVLAHDHVIFARTLLSNIGYKSSKKRSELDLHKNMVIDDLRVIDMYEAAILHDTSQLKERKGNWVQKFATPDDAQLYASAQFYRYQEVERFLEEHLKDAKAVRKQVSKEVKP
ncbi:DUF4062 domain-containing protein [Desulfobacterium sp. N47]|uniref:DUF4062 domain-containing protein n=1 Tax=uncultured Desulfobacterium sp. TaxID=201089 RepID=E1Y896_9BACT|nr:hypothetical protein N47_A08190 [uncultured Desulfobacterium sp.]